MKKGAHSASILSSVFKFPLWELVFISVAAAENPNYTLFITSRNGGNMNLYETVKGRVTPQMAAERYDLPVNRSGMACCPFHNDRTPSMKLNEEYFYCFGCKAKGDVIDFVARLFNLSSYEAAQKLLAKLGLTMEDVKEFQKKAAQNTSVKTENKPAKVPAKKTIQVHNTNTAMGKALAQAMGGVTLTETKEVPAKKDNAAERLGSIERRISDKGKLAVELGIGEITLTDIIKELEKPARDPRADMPAPVLRSDVLDMKDLKPGMILKGTVRNVIDFGVFVDIGVHQDGLVHISQITDRFIKHPLEAVSVGDVVDVQVLSVDVAKKRIGLTMKIAKDKK